MSNLELSADQIIDLIFEKKIYLNDTNICVKHSCLSILSKLEERIYAESVFKRNAPTSFVRGDLKRAIKSQKKKCLGKQLDKMIELIF